MHKVFQLQKGKQKLSIAMVQTKVVSYKLCTQKLSQRWRNVAIFFLCVVEILSFGCMYLIPLVSELSFYTIELVLKIFVAILLQKICESKIVKKIAKLRQSCDSFCVHMLQKTNVDCTIAIDNCFIHYCNYQLLYVLLQFLTFW